jgi:uncharacterized protein (DUF2141 family)
VGHSPSDCVASQQGALGWRLHFADATCLTDVEKRLKFHVVLVVTTGVTLIAAPASAGQTIPNDMNMCAGEKTAVLATVRGIEVAEGTIRVQSYRATKADWLKKGRWLTRIEAPATSKTMRFCIPMDGPGTYAIALRHDINGNGKTDIFKDGGGMSNNPSISIWNLGKPSYKKVAIQVEGPTSITIDMRYM